MSRSENQGTTVVVIEMGPGHVRVRFAGSSPEPSRADLLIRKTIDAWFSARPRLVIDRVQPVIEAEGMVGADVWFHATEVTDPETPHHHADEAPPWTIEVSGHVLGMLPKEHVEAVIDEAMGVWNEEPDRLGSLVVVNARRIAVVLDGQVRKGAVVPIEEIGQKLDDRTMEDLRRWFESPRTRLFAIPVTYAWFDRQAYDAAKPKVVEPSFVRTNMVYDRG